MPKYGHHLPTARSDATHDHALDEPPWALQLGRRTARRASAPTGRSWSVLPDLPLRLAVVPEGVELLPVAERVHPHPEALVPVDAELAVAGQALQRGVLEHDLGGVRVEVPLQKLALEEEEATVDVAGLRLLL